MTHPSSPLGNLRFEVVSQTGGQAIVRVQGQTYRFKISEGTGTGWEDVTSLTDWTILAKHVTELFLAHLDTSSIDKGELIVQETAARTLSFVSAYAKSGSREQEIQGERDFHSLPIMQQRAVERKLGEIANDFAAIRPLSSAPLSHLESDSRRPIPTNIRGTDINHSGRCLDASLAYQMLKKAGKKDLLKGNKVTVYEVAEALRETVAQKIRNDKSLDRNMLFMQQLRNSLQNIPIDDFPKKSTYQKIQAIARQDAPLSPKQKEILRRAYASYITTRTSSGIMEKYLDAAFLAALPLIEVTPSLHARFPQGFRCAVIQNNRLLAKYPEDAPLSLKGWLFVNYQGENHYDAIDIEQNREKLQEIIDR